jgi:hypothetical protein
MGCTSDAAMHHIADISLLINTETGNFTCGTVYFHALYRWKRHDLQKITIFYCHCIVMRFRFIRGARIRPLRYGGMDKLQNGVPWPGAAMLRQLHESQPEYDENQLYLQLHQGHARML